MPFASQKQRAYLYARHPEIAKRFRRESGPQRGLPEYSRKSKGKKRSPRRHLYEKAASRGHAA